MSFGPEVVMGVDTKELLDLVREDRVHRRVYTDPAVFAVEMARIWGYAWIYVGHESQVPDAGSFITTTIGVEPVTKRGRKK